MYSYTVYIYIYYGLSAYIDNIILYVYIYIHVYIYYMYILYIYTPSYTTLCDIACALHCDKLRRNKTKLEMKAWRWGQEKVAAPPLVPHWRNLWGCPLFPVCSEHEESAPSSQDIWQNFATYILQLTIQILTTSFKFVSQIAWHIRINRWFLLAAFGSFNHVFTLSKSPRSPSAEWKPLKRSAQRCWSPGTRPTRFMVHRSWKSPKRPYYTLINGISMVYLGASIVIGDTPIAGWFISWKKHK